MKKLITILFVFAMVLVFSMQSHAGWSTLVTDNGSSVDWTNLNVEIFAIPDQSGPLYDISNVTFDSPDPSDITNPFLPLSNLTLDPGNEWNESPDGKKINFNFFGAPYAAGDVLGEWKVHSSNPDQALFGVSYYPLGGGWSSLVIDNSSSVDWTNLNVEIFAIPGQSGPLYDISNVTFDSPDPSDITNPFLPLSNLTLDPGNEWNESPDGKKINFNFFGAPYAAGDVLGEWKVHISNPDQVLHGVKVFPSVVPEPVSSTLFIVGGATLGFRRFRKKFIK